MAVVVLSEYARRNNFYDDFHSFLVRKDVITVASGVIIGIATSGFIRHATHDIVMPVLNLALFGLIKLIHKPSGTWLSRFVTNSKFQWVHFVQETLMWIAVLVVSFLLINYGILRMSKNVPLPPQTSVTQEESFTWS